MPDRNRNETTMIILKFLFSIILIGFVLLLIMLVAFGGTAAFLLRRMFHLMKEEGAQGQSDHVNVHRKGTHTREEIIIDTRDADSQQKQIFGDDEGEYVEYEEEGK